MNIKLEGSVAGFEKLGKLEERNIYPEIGTSAD